MARNLSYGSSGDDVKKLQELLNRNGANLDVDGVFGSKTESAVKAYQQKNGLAVDGIAGVNTMGSLTKANTENKQSPGTSTPITTNTDAGASSSSSTGTTGDIVTQAQELLNNQLQGGNAQPKWSDQINDIINQIMNREPFAYDMNADKLYDQYKGQYQAQGKLAMEDAIGKAAALTGGYGNSYAQQVGQQTYQGYLDQLNDRIPELYSLALSKYQMEGDALTDKLSLLTQQEQEQYDRALTMYQLLGYATPEVAEILGIPESTGSGGSSSSGSGYGSGGGGNWDNDGLEDWQIKAMQEYLGVTPDGKWGKESAEAIKGMTASEAWNVLGPEVVVSVQDEDSGAGAGGDGNTKPTITLNDLSARAKRFVSRIEHPRESMNRTGTVRTPDGKVYKDYDEYVLASIDRELNNETITEEDAQHLMDYYGV